MDDNTTAGLIHLLYVFGLGIASIIIWVVKKDDSVFIDEHGKAFLDHFITVLIVSTIVGSVTGLLMIVLIGFILMPIALSAISIYTLVVGIMASVAAFKGEYYRYPISFGIVKWGISY